MNPPLLAFYGDDFTGSTDAMESLALGGVRTVLFTRPPTRDQLARYEGLRAFGVAGMTRSMSPDEMDRNLRPALIAMRECGAALVHYKVCSTFDSSPTIGSIGRAIDVGAEVFDATVVPVVVGAPTLGRYCVFGNLFARCGTESEPYRLDRHPSMSRHPITPMLEADLRLHLAKQTSKSIGLIDVTQLGGAKLDDRPPVVLIDLMSESQLAAVGELIATSRYVVGSSGVEASLMAHWKCDAQRFAPVRAAGPIVAVCGSCSPVTARQIDWALSNGFVDVPFEASEAKAQATAALHGGRSVIVHSRQMRPDDRFARIVREVVEASHVRRMLVAGGDTSGTIARALGIESLEMIGELTRGSPMCRAAAPGSPADGIEITFKGGQIGPADFFGLVEKGHRRG